MARWDRRSSTAVPLVGVVLVLALVLALSRSSQDVVLYKHYASFELHRPALHSWPREYPALAGIFFLLPAALPMPYRAGLALVLAAVLLVLVAAGDRSGPDGAWARRLVIYLGLGTVWVLFARFDLLPALAVLLAVERARSGRWRTAWSWALLGGLLKLFPLLLLPGFFIAEWRASGRAPLRRILLASGAVALVAGLQSAIAPGSVLDPIRYELQRGFELSSVSGSLTLLMDPAHLHWTSAYGAREIVGHGHAEIAYFLLIAAAAGMALTWLLAARGRVAVETTALAVLSVAVLGDKALAPQYLVWLAPLWAYWRLRWEWIAAAVLTTLVYPVSYALVSPGLLHSYALPTELAALRNVLLLTGTVRWYLVSVRGPAHRDPGQAAGESPEAAVPSVGSGAGH